MTLSSDVLPAPFGPMMARISPLRMSNDTSEIAFTPPNASDTFSTESSTSPASTSRPDGALTRRLLLLPLPGGERVGVRGLRTPQVWPGTPSPGRFAADLSPPGRGEESARSRRLLHGRQGRLDLDVADLEARRHGALAAVLERHLGGDRRLVGAAVERRDQRAVAIAD